MGAGADLNVLEAVARAIAEPILVAFDAEVEPVIWEKISPKDQATITAIARASLLALRSNISEEMQRAGGLAINDDADVLVVTAHEASLAFTAMLDAALSTDFSTSVMRVSRADYLKLTTDQRELLRAYAASSWEEPKGTLCFEVAAYRVEQITSAVPWKESSCGLSR